jgi:hypothetical protein
MCQRISSMNTQFAQSTSFPTHSCTPLCTLAMTIPLHQYWWGCLAQAFEMLPLPPYPYLHHAHNHTEQHPHSAGANPPLTQKVTADRRTSGGISSRVYFVSVPKSAAYSRVAILQALEPWRDFHNTVSLLHCAGTVIHYHANL